MLEFITTLKQRYQVIQTGFAEQSTQWIAYQASIEQLTLIESVLHKGQLVAEKRAVLNIAVIGPTQSGKSTVVNLLLNQTAAGVSPLAGFTVHPQGFAMDLSADNLLGIEAHFSGFQKVDQFSLSADHYNSYSVSQVSSESLPPSLLWDTPDFDSIDAYSYQEGVLKTLALADVLVLVVSKEKYADQSVWDTMRLVEPLKQPVLVVLNKLVADSQDIIIESFQERWQQVRKDKLPSIMPILFTKGGVADIEQIKLIRLLDSRIANVQWKRQDDVAIAFIKQHWESWLAPIRAEQEAYVQWQKLIADAVQEAGLEYQRDYLDHPQHYETFQDAIARLLTLLEIPGVSKVFAQTRKILTWPLRKILSRGAKKQVNGYPISTETAVLKQIAEHVFFQLGDKILSQVDLSDTNSQWWKSVNRQLREDKAVILQGFEKSSIKHHEDFKQEVDKTAQGLYQKLDEHPLILNGLRVTRMTADAAMLALALETGGIGLHDLVIAPAMLAVTSYLAESAVGGYFNKAEVRLKRQQLITVKQILFAEVLQHALMTLPEKMLQKTYFNISASQLAEAEAQLEDKRHGLRIL